MKKILSIFTIAGLLMSGASFAFAGSEWEQKSYSISDLESIEAERYWSVEKKWKVEVEFKDDSEKVFYVYKIDTKNDLIDEIEEGLRNNFGINALTNYIESILEYDIDDINGTKEEEDSEVEIEKVYVDKYSIQRKWQVDVQLENKSSKDRLYVYEIDSETELHEKVASAIENTYAMKFDVSDLKKVIVMAGDFDDLTDHNVDYKKDKEKDVKKETKKEEPKKEVKDTSDKDAQIKALEKQIQELLTLLIQLLSAKLAL